MRRSIILIMCALLIPVVLLAGKQYDLDESVDLNELKTKLELFKKTRQVISDNIGGLMKIHTTYKQSNPDLAGQMMVKVWVNKTGEVTKNKVVSSEIKHEEFTQKILAKVKEWKFGDMPKEEQEVLIPFYFK